jgi:hypothetical protein
MRQEKRVCAVADLLKKMIQAASCRTNLAVTLTAGWDSRLVLAACDEVKEKIDVVTLKYHHIADSHIDIQIPKHLCEKYGYIHKTLPCKSLETDFVEAYKVHSENAHEYWMQMTQSVRDYGYEDWFWTKGSCNEVSRNSSGILIFLFIYLISFHKANAICSSAGISFLPKENRICVGSQACRATYHLPSALHQRNGNRARYVPKPAHP